MARWLAMEVPNGSDDAVGVHAIFGADGIEQGLVAVAVIAVDLEGAEVEGKFAQREGADTAGGEVVGGAALGLGPVEVFGVFVSHAGRRWRLQYKYTGTPVSMMRKAMALLTGVVTTVLTTMAMQARTKRRGGVGMAGRTEDGARGRAAVVAAEEEEGRGGEGEGDEVHGDLVIENLLVLAGAGDGGGGDALEEDGDDRRAGARGEPADAAEEQAIAGHGVVDARRGQHALAEEAERGNGDPGGDPERAAVAQGTAHDVGGGRGGTVESFGAEDFEADHVDGDIEHDDTDHAEHDAPREVAARVAHFGGDEGGGLPPAIGEAHGDHGSTERSEEAEGHGPVEKRGGVDGAAAHGQPYRPPARRWRRSSSA